VRRAAPLTSPVTNRGTRRFSPARPGTLSGGDRVKTDANQDSAETHLDALDPGRPAM